jgi:hypothetical protein
VKGASNGFGLSSWSADCERWIEIKSALETKLRNAGT